MPPSRRAPKPAPAPTETSPTAAPPSLPPGPEAQFSWIPLADVRKWDKNPRDNRAAIPKVAASIRRFGVVSAPVVWTSQGRLVAGHTRIAAMELILETDPTFVPVGAPPGTRPGLVPIRFHEFASDEEATAYAIADNRLGELAQWDTEKLPELLGGLDATLAGLTGFTVDLPVLDLPPPPGAPPEDTGPKPESGTTSNRPPRDPHAVVIHYDLIFEDEAQQKEWGEVLKHARSFPGDTHAARLLAFVRAARAAGV